MRSILRKLALTSVALAAVALAANTAMAAESRVNVPFNFTLRSVDASRSFTWLLRAGEPAPTDTNVTLRFDEQAQGYTLQSVQYRSLITPKLDKNAPHSEHKAVRMVEGQ